MEADLLKIAASCPSMFANPPTETITVVGWVIAVTVISAAFAFAVWWCNPRGPTKW